MIDNQILWKAIGLFFKQLPASESGVVDKEGKTITWEKLVIGIGKFTITILAEEVVEDLYERLERAVEAQNFELASELRDRIARMSQQEDDDMLLNEEDF